MRRRRSIAGPIVLITIGVLFACDYIWGRWSFWRETWPIVLIVFGLVRLVEHMTADDTAFCGPNTPPWDKNWRATPWQDKDWARRQAMGENPPPPPGTPGVPPGTAPPAPPAASSAPEYPSYPVYPPSSSSSGSGEGHAS